MREVNERVHGAIEARPLLFRRALPVKLCFRHH